VRAGLAISGSRRDLSPAEDTIVGELPCDIFLGAHGDYFGLETKHRLMKEERPNPFVDPAGYKKFVAQKEQDFRTELAKQELDAK